MTEQRESTKFNLTLVQVAASALAAVTAAILGSRLGVAGTVIGAGVASVTTTVASAIYQHSLERSGARMRGAAAQSRLNRRYLAAVAAFGLALLVVTGLEAARGAPLSGGDGTTVGRVLGGGGGPAPTVVSPTPSTTPPTTTSPPEPSAPVTSPSQTSTSETLPSATTTPPASPTTTEGPSTIGSTDNSR